MPAFRQHQETVKINTNSPGAEQKALSAKTGNKFARAIIASAVCELDGPNPILEISKRLVFMHLLLSKFMAFGVPRERSFAIKACLEWQLLRYAGLRRKLTPGLKTKGLLFIEECFVHRLEGVLTFIILFFERKSRSASIAGCWIAPHGTF
jgi:hypothetical protein